MKKTLLLILVAVALFSCGGDTKPVEISIAKNDVDLNGNAFQSFKLGGEIRLLMTPNTNESSKWMIRATAPIQKTSNLTIGQMSAEINLLDDHGIKVREGFSLSAEDLEAIIPVFNAIDESEKTIVFSAGEGMKRDFTYKEAVELINNVKKIGLTINVSNSSNVTPTEATTETTTETTTVEEQSKPLTLNDLLKNNGVYGLLSQYEKCLKKGDKKKAKQVEDRLYTIEKRVKNDESIPKSLRQRFVDYIENKEDEIEKKY